MSNTPVTYYLVLDDDNLDETKASISAMSISTLDREAKSKGYLLVLNTDGQYTNYFGERYIVIATINSDSSSFELNKNAKLLIEAGKKIKEYYSSNYCYIHTGIESNVVVLVFLAVAKFCLQFLKLAVLPNKKVNSMKESN